MGGNDLGSSSERGAISEEALERIVEMVGDNSEVLLDLFETYLVESARLVKSMHSALEVSDDHGLMIAAHSLKSTSATFGATELALLSGTLEQATLGELPNLDQALLVGKIDEEYSYVSIAVQAQIEQWRSA